MSSVLIEIAGNEESLLVLQKAIREVLTTGGMQALTDKEQRMTVVIQKTKEPLKVTLSRKKK